MSTFIKVKPENLAPRLMAKAKRDRAALSKAAMAAALRFQRHLSAQVDKLGITDRGLYKRSITVKRSGLGAVLAVEAPHAGIVENGARPHKVSQEGRDALARWARRKLGLSKKDALDAAWGIAAKIEKEGQKGTHVVRNSMPAARRFYAVELARAIRGNKRGESTR